jgi:hypothetical protein
MFWDDEVQGAADRFLRQITKEFGRGAVPDLNHALSICEDDPIRGLLDDEPEQVKARLELPATSYPFTRRP